MAFGDVTQWDDKVHSESNPTDSVTATFGVTPTESALLLALHFTGSSVSNGPGGWSEALLLTDGTNNDEGGIYYKIAGASEPSTVECTSVSADEQMLIAIEVEGPWEVSSLDKTAKDDTPTTSTDADSGNTATTAQADEFAIGLITVRTSTNNPIATTWLNSFTGLVDTHSSDEGIDGYKQASVGYRVLAATGTYKAAATLDESKTWMAGIATFKKQISAAVVGPFPTFFRVP